MNTTMKSGMTDEDKFNDFTYGGAPVLSDTIMNDLKALYPYIVDAPCGAIPFDNLVETFKSFLYPEGYIFFWRQQVLSVVHALNQLSYTGSPLERPPIPEATSLGKESTLNKYRSFPKKQRERFHRTIFTVLMVPEKFSIEYHRDLEILAAAKEVNDAMAEDYERMEKGRLARIGKEFGSVCCNCKSNGKGRMICSRCKKAFYCGRKCQKAHWPDHKTECLKEEEPSAHAHELYRLLAL